MALTLKFTTKLSTDGKSLRFTETTGVYDSVNNPTGWGVSGSPSIGSINSCKIYITLDNETEYTIDVLSSPLPSSSNGYYDITSEDIGLDAGKVLPDGVYTIKYEVGVVSDNTYISKLAYVLLDREVKCCVFKKIENILDLCDTCHDKKVIKYLLPFAYHKALLGAVKLGRLEKSREILIALQKYCSQTNCGC
jgi:hypothetical protein